MIKNKIYKYKNGATLIYSHRENENSTSGVIGFSCGSKLDGMHQGISHFLEHMLFTGTKTSSKNQIYEILASTDTYQNAFTTKDSICMDFDCPSCHADTIFKLNSDMLLKKDFDEKEMKAEIHPILEELNNSQDDAIMDTAIAELTGNNLPYRLIGTKDNITSEYILGSRESLEAITPKDLKDYSDKYFVSENLIMSVVSSLPFSQVKELCDKYFVSKVPSNAKNKIDASQSKYNYIKKDKLLTKDTPYMKSFQTQFFFKSSAKPGIENAKFTMIENWIFNDFRGKLNTVLREEKGLTYTSSFENINFNNLNLKLLNIVTSPEKIKEALNATIEILQDIIMNGLTQKDLTKYYLQMLSKKDRNPKSFKNNAGREFFAYLYHNTSLSKDKLFDELSKTSLKEINDYLFRTYGNSHVGIIYNGDMFSAQKIPTEKDVKDIADFIKYAPLTISDEKLLEMSEQKNKELFDKIELMPTLNELTDKFKFSNRILKEMFNNTIKIPKILSKNNVNKCQKLKINKKELNKQVKKLIEKNNEKEQIQEAEIEESQM